MTCTDPGYHEHSCEGASLERIADALEALARLFMPSQGGAHAPDRAIGYTAFECERTMRTMGLHCANPEEHRS